RGLAGADRVAGRERTRERERALALLAREPRVPRREREPIRVANGGDGADLDLEVEVEDEAAEHLELLRVLLPEVRALRSDDVEELATDCCNPSEVRRADGALEDRAELLDLDPRLEPGRVHLRDRRREQQVD